jgi:hypothetical protein
MASGIRVASGHPPTARSGSTLALSVTVGRHRVPGVPMADISAAGVVVALALILLVVAARLEEL